MADNTEQKRPSKPAPVKPTQMTNEDVARLADEGLRLRRALEERVAKQPSASVAETRIRFR